MDDTRIPLDTPLAAFHATSGATLSTWFDCSLPDHWSDPLVEQLFALGSVALLDKNYRCYLSFAGPDRVRYLNAILTNNIKDLATNRGTVSLLLNPQGHIVAEIETNARPESLFCISYAMIREHLIEWLDKYIIMDDVTLTDESQRFGTLALEGPEAASVAKAVSGVDLSSLQELESVETVAAALPCVLTRRSPGDPPGCEFLVERAHVANLWEALLAQVKQHGGGPVGYAALSALRLAQSIPWFGYDFGEKQIPHEAGLQNSHISYTKGCYTGQEIVERVRSRGQVNRQRVSLVFDGTSLPASGELLTADGKEAGVVTRAALFVQRSTVIGMGYVRREFAAPGTVLRWSGGSATVSNFPDALR
jgi:folate-binding protein YgfZ